jgi:rhodanese-related sulfurtransferase
MATPDTITVAQLSRLIGTPDAPVMIDLRTDADCASDPRRLPGSIRRDFRAAASWAGEYAGRSVVAICQHGQSLSQGVAAWLRQAGAHAEHLDGGFETWAKGGHLLVRPDHVPPPDERGRTIWVTRVRPKIDRIACPWLIRRFVDPAAVFLFVTPAAVTEIAERFRATPFDIEGVFWSHRGEFCTFDVMVEEFGLHCEHSTASR